MASIIDILIRARNQASKELDDVTSKLKGMDQATKLALGGLSAFAGGLALQQAGRFAVEMSQLNTQIERSAFAFEHFSGGADQAAANLRAVQRASGGMLTEFQAQNLAVTAMTQSLASNSMELQRITKIARGIVAVSPIINDLESAFSQLGLTIANQSMVRLDQLGTSAEELKPKIEALKQSNKSLSDEEAFRAALLDTLENKMNTLTSAAINQASGLERLAVAWNEYKNSASGAFAWVDSMAGFLANRLDTTNQVNLGAWLADQMGNPDFMEGLTYAQKQIISKLREITTMGNAEMLAMGYDEWSSQVANLVEQYYNLADAAAKNAQVFDKNMNVMDPRNIQGPQLPTFFTGQDWQKQIETDAAAADEAKAAIDKLIEAQSTAIQVDVFENTGNVQQAAAAYAVVTEQLNAWVERQKRAGVEISTIMSLLPSVAGMFIDLGNTAVESGDKMADAIESAALAAARSIYEASGNADEASEAYRRMGNSLRNFVDAQRAHGLSEAEILNLLTTEAGLVQQSEQWWLRYSEAVDSATLSLDMLGGAMGRVIGMMGAVNGAIMGIAGTASDFLNELTSMMGGAEMSLFGIGADNGQGLQGGRDYVAEMLPEVQSMVNQWIANGATLEEITTVLLPDYLSDLRSANAELYTASKSVLGVNDGYNKLKSTVSSIVSGAIGPVAGVDANDLLANMGMRPDAVNENARRLASLAVNGIDPKSQPWLEEFKNEVPGIWEEIANSDDPKAAAAKILKDFQDGLRPELLDKERAKELVKRALIGDANTKQLIDEIAGELANEMGISLGEAKAKATEVLGGGTGETTGVSLAPTIDGAAAASAASTFASAFTSAIEGGSLGADLGGALMVQITASLAMVEETGRTAGNGFIKGFTGTFDSIPTAFIAAVVSLAMPGIMSNINTNGGRTGAAET